MKKKYDKAVAKIIWSHQVSIAKTCERAMNGEKMKEKNTTAAVSDKPLVIGLPRAMLYNRYRILWKSFFSNLGIKVIVSKPTGRVCLENGSALAIDEACLSTKIYLGHVQSLIGKCDYILVPRISNFGRKRVMCTKFESLYDVVGNVFRDSHQKFIAYNVDELKQIDEEKGLIDLGITLGFDKKMAAKAYKAAKKAEHDRWKNAVDKEEELYKAKGIKVMLAAHSYILEDKYVGEPIKEFLKEMQVTAIRADLVNRKEALKQAAKISPTNKWEFSRELMGSIQMHKDKVDGVILVSAFPCGPDSMVNEMMMRKFPELPMLNIVVDNQNGTAGLETRLESFVDILKLKRGVL